LRLRKCGAVNSCERQAALDGAKNLQITRELESRREMKVVEQLDLMLDSKAATERDGSSPLLPSLRDIAS